MITNEEIDRISNILSAPRFATYLRACDGHRQQAMALYQWNLEISAAFIVPLHVFEISARNGVVEALENVHGENWPWSIGFRRSLPRPAKAWQYNPETDLHTLARRLPTAGKIVAELKFAFWEKLFTSGQDRRLWEPHFRTSFPRAPTDATIPELRAITFQTLRDIRFFRNRIAHHEPIFPRDLRADLQRLELLIRWRDPTTADWVERIQTVTRLLEARPRPN